MKGSKPGALGICHRINQINLELLLSDREKEEEATGQRNILIPLGLAAEKN